MKDHETTCGHDCTMDHRTLCMEVTELMSAGQHVDMIELRMYISCKLSVNKSCVYHFKHSVDFKQCVLKMPLFDMWRLNLHRVKTRTKCKPVDDGTGRVDGR